MKKAFGFKRTPNLLNMKKVLHRSSVFFLMAIIFSFPSCFSPSPILRLNPIAEDIKWNYGRQIIHLQEDDFEMSIAFEGFDQEHIIFDVAIANYSNEEILMSPKDFYLTDDNENWLGNAVDPELAIFQLDSRTSKQVADAKNASIAAGVLLVGLVVADAIIESNNNDDDNDDWCDDDDDDYYFFLGDNARVNTKPIPVAEQRAFLTDYTFRKTHVEPNRIINGKILFPRRDDQIFLSVNFPIRKTIFSAKFRQILYQPH